MKNRVNQKTSLWKCAVMGAMIFTIMETAQAQLTTVNVTGVDNGDPLNGTSDLGTLSVTTRITSAGSPQDMVYTITGLDIDGVGVDNDSVEITFTGTTNGGAFNAAAAGYLSTGGSTMTGAGDYVQLSYSSMSVNLNGITGNGSGSFDGFTSVNVGSWNATGDQALINGVSYSYDAHPSKDFSITGNSMKVENESGSMRVSNWDFQLTLGTAVAQVFTEPVGTVKITCPGSAVTTISASLRGSTEYQGAAASIAAGTIDTGVTSWSAAQWTTEPYLCYIENDAGAEEAYLISSMDETTGVLTLATDHDLTARYSATPTPTYRIRKAVTLGNFFDIDPDPAIISASFETSDRVYLWNGSGWDSYVYFSFWRKVGDLAPNRNDTVLMPNLGMYILRGAASDLVITHSGAVPMLDQVSTITGKSFISNRFPVGTTLGTSGIHEDANWNANDRIYLWNGSGWDAYYYQTFWRLSTDAQTNADNTVINPESAIFVVRDAAVAADSAGVTQPNPYTP